MMGAALKYTNLLDLFACMALMVKTIPVKNPPLRVG